MVEYQLLAHRAAKRELETLPAKAEHDLREVIDEVAATEQPSQHERAKPLEGQPGLFRVRAGDARAVVTLDKPCLLVLRVGLRKDVYRDIDSIHRRTPA